MCYCSGIVARHHKESLASSSQSVFYLKKLVIQGLPARKNVSSVVDIVRNNSKCDQCIFNKALDKNGCFSQPSNP